MKRLVFVALVCVAMCALRAGVVVDAQTDVPRRICTNEVTFAWDWNWDWVPANAQSATVVVESQEGNVFSNTVARPATSMTWRVFNTTSRIVDATYNVTLSFPCVGNLAASRTVSYELRTDSFASHVRACETNSARGGLLTRSSPRPKPAALRKPWMPARLHSSPRRACRPLSTRRCL